MFANVQNYILLKLFIDRIPNLQFNMFFLGNSYDGEFFKRNAWEMQN